MVKSDYEKLSVNERLRVARLLKKWPQKKLSERLGFRKQSNLSDIENGRRNLTNKLLDKACEVLELSRDWMLTGKGQIFTQKIGNGDEVKKRPDFDMSEFFDALIAYTEDTRPTRYAKKLTLEQIDFELNIGYNNVKDAYCNYQKLVDFLHGLGAPNFLLEKFSKAPDFQSYIKNQEDDFIESWEFLHGSTKKMDERALKLIRIEDLYHPLATHWNEMLTKLINYMHDSVDLIKIRSSKGYES